MKKNKGLFLNWFLVFLWLGVIYFFSDQPNLKSEFKPFWDLIFRKVAHLSEFFVLAYFIYRANLRSGFRKNHSLFLGLIGVIICAGFDEYHQTFVFGRQGSSVDVLIDSFGGLIFFSLEFFRINKSK